MKFIIKLILTLFIVALSFKSIESSQNLRLLKKSKTKLGTCLNTYEDPLSKPPIGNVPIKDKDVFPADYQATLALENAKIQNKAARNLFYNMPKSAVDVLKNVAKNYSIFYQLTKKKENKIDPFKTLENIERQTGNAGTWQVFNSVTDFLVKAKVTQKFDKKTSTDVDVLVENQESLKSTFHKDIISRISNGYDTSLSQYLGFLGLLGDIGSCLQDVNNRSENNDDKKKIHGWLISYFGEGLAAYSKKFYEAYSPDKYYDSATATKKGDRNTCLKDDGRPNLAPRIGVLNKGKDADAEITVGGTKASALSDDKKFPEVGWPWQTVPKDIVDKCKTEPWAGHYSGSLYELILMLELFDRADPKKDDSATLSKDKKNVYAALASGFLISTGMHSAVEVVYVDKKYTGLDTSLTPGDLVTKVCTDATKIVAGIITGLK